MRARSLLLFAACNLAACGPTYSPVAPDTAPEPGQPGIAPAMRNN